MLCDGVAEVFPLVPFMGVNHVPVLVSLSLNCPCDLSEFASRIRHCFERVYPETARRDGLPVVRSSLVTPEGAAEIADWVRQRLRYWRASA